jgi:hypothetical protein
VSPCGIELQSLAKTFSTARLPSASVDESLRSVAPPAFTVVKPTKQSCSEATIESPRGVTIEALAAIKPNKQSDSDMTLESPCGVTAGFFDAVRLENRLA